MPANTIRTLIRGNVFSGSSYQDAVQLFRDVNTDAGSPFSPAGFITPAAFATLKGTTGRVANIATGFVNLGPTDELLVCFGGRAANNATFNWALTAVYPVIAPTDDSRDTITGYMQMLAAFGSAGGILGSATIGAAGAAALGGATASGDFLADTIVNNYANAPYTVQNNQQNDGLAGITLRAPGAVGVIVATQIVTATHVFAFGSRRQGLAQRSNRS